jgi:hypothetical protein
MNKKLQCITVLLTLSFLFSSCEAIGAIFKAGVWSGILIVVLVIVLIAFIVRGISKK